jgi:hypothetical protein
MRVAYIYLPGGIFRAGLETDYMKKYYILLALGLLVTSAAAQARGFSLPPQPLSCESSFANLFGNSGNQGCGQTVSVPEPATLGLLGVGLLGLAIKRRRK